MAFGQDEVRYVFGTALRKVAEIGAYTCAFEQEENVSVFVMKWVKRNRRMRSSYEMPKS